MGHRCNNNSTQLGIWPKARHFLCLYRRLKLEYFVPTRLYGAGVAFATLSFCLFTNQALARKTNQALYEDPFDVAAGGASLTRASQVGVLFANPAQLSYGGKFHRWLGSETVLMVNKESVETVRNLINGSSSESDSSTTTDTDTTADSDSASTNENSEFIDKLFTDPLHVGSANTLGYINKLFGIAAFQRFSLDVRARKYGETGLPELRTRVESYNGVVAGMPIWTPFRWLALGAAAKYVLASEPDLSIEVTDQEKISSLQDPNEMTKLASFNRGAGVDAGALMLFQGKTLDYAVALKVDDVGDTKLTGDGDLNAFKQVISAGVAMTLHTGADGLHLALDYRDLQNKYEEDLFKKLYLGAKLTLRTYVGLAAGYYNGYPSYGAEVDLIFLRLSATSYTRELGDNAGSEPRNIYQLSLAMGI